MTEQSDVPQPRKRSARKPANPLAKLDPRRREYVLGCVEGKSKFKAALAAGFTPSVAAKPGSKIENDDVRTAFRWAVQQVIPKEKIIERLREGLDAEYKTPIMRGKEVVDWHTEVDFRERREYMKLAAEYGGYYVPKQEVDGSLTVQHECGERLARLLALGAARDNPETDAS